MVNFSWKKHGPYKRAPVYFMNLTVFSPPFGRHVEERHKRQCGEEDGHDVAYHDAAMLVEEEEWEVIQGRF